MPAVIDELGDEMLGIRLTNRLRTPELIEKEKVITLLLAMSYEEKGNAMSCGEGTPGRSHCLAKSAALAQAAEAIKEKIPTWFTRKA